MKKSGSPAQVEVSMSQTLPEGSREDRRRLLFPHNAEARRSFTTQFVLSGAFPALPPGRVEVLTTQLKTAAQKDPDVYAGVLRGWLRQEKA